MQVVAPLALQNLLPLLFIVSVWTLAQQSTWRAQRDNFDEYQLTGSVSGVSSDIECAALAKPEDQAVKLSKSEGLCRMYRCQLGYSGCRKCRNARNLSLPLLLIRVLNDLSAAGHNCWQTFQRRVDGSVDFYRNWTQYLSMFGDGENRNYWMGLKAIHQLTKAGDRRVRWEMQMWNGSWYWMEDLSFSVLGDADGYKALVGQQDVNRSNVVRCNTQEMNNRRFTTPDRDQDTKAINCAVKFQGPWWHDGCHCFNPNGRYITPPTAYSLVDTLWAAGLSFRSLEASYPFNHCYSMMTVECLVSAYL